MVHLIMVVSLLKCIFILFGTVVGWILLSWSWLPIEVRTRAYSLHEITIHVCDFSFLVGLEFHKFAL